VMARKSFKVLLGLWESPIERPIFALCATVLWFLTLLLWRPISNCRRFSVFEVSPAVWAVSGTVIAGSALLIVALLWRLPGHVFGTDRYAYRKGKYPTGKLLTKVIPYSLVRHPAACGFLWAFLALPSYTPNHLLLMAEWLPFIVIGTLVFEEGGLRGPDEFGKSYAAYADDVSALYVKPSLLLQAFSFASESDSTAAKKTRSRSPKSSGKSH